MTTYECNRLRWGQRIGRDYEGLRKSQELHEIRGIVRNYVWGYSRLQECRALGKVETGYRTCGKNATLNLRGEASLRLLTQKQILLMLWYLSVLVKFKDNNRQKCCLPHQVHNRYPQTFSFSMITVFLKYCVYREVNNITCGFGNWKMFLNTAEVWMGF